MGSVLHKLLLESVYNEILFFVRVQWYILRENIKSLHMAVRVLEF